MFGINKSISNRAVPRLTVVLALMQLTSRRNAGVVHMLVSAHSCVPQLVPRVALHSRLSPLYHRELGGLEQQQPVSLSQSYSVTEKFYLNTSITAWTIALCCLLNDQDTRHSEQQCHGSVFRTNAFSLFNFADGACHTHLPRSSHR